MKQLLLLITTVSLLGTACKKEKKPAPVEQAVTKSVEYHLYAEKDYSAPIYKDVNAEVRLEIRKINYLTGAMELVWDSTLPKQKIADFPLKAGKIIISKSFPILESHQKLNGSYGIKFTENSTIWQQGESDEAVPGEKLVFLEVKI